MKERVVKGQHKHVLVLWEDRLRRHSNATAQMNPWYRVRRCRLNNKAVFHTRAKTTLKPLKHTARL